MLAGGCMQPCSKGRTPAHPAGVDVNAQGFLTLVHGLNPRNDRAVLLRGKHHYKYIAAQSDSLCARSTSWQAAARVAELATATPAAPATRDLSCSAAPTEACRCKWAACCQGGRTCHCICGSPAPAERATSYCAVPLCEHTKAERDRGLKTCKPGSCM